MFPHILRMKTLIKIWPLISCFHWYVTTYESPLPEISIKGSKWEVRFKSDWQSYSSQVKAQYFLVHYYLLLYYYLNVENNVNSTKAIWTHKHLYWPGLELWIINKTLFNEYIPMVYLFADKRPFTNFVRFNQMWQQKHWFQTGHKDENID
jgi:hypothetical protein